MVSALNRFLSALAGKKHTQAQAKQTEETPASVGHILREFAEHPSKGLTPAKLYDILEGAERGDIAAQHALFCDMEEKDPQIAADLAKRRQMAAELEWQIVAPPDATDQEQAATEYCNAVFNQLDVEELIIDMGTAIGHGWVNLELDWQLDNGLYTFGQPIMRDHAWFAMDKDQPNTLLLRTGMNETQALRPFGWLQHIHKAKAGYLSRSGLHRVLAWPYLFQNYALGDLAQLLDIYGIPMRLGKYHSSATEKEKRTLLRAVTQMGHNAAGIIPQGMEIDFIEATKASSDVYLAMMNWAETAKAKVILGSTLTSGTGEGTNTNALGNVHERGTMSLIRADARQYASSINRDMLYPLVAVNFGIDALHRAPKFYLETTENEDITVLANSLPALVELGAQVPVEWLHDRAGIPMAEDGQTVLKTPAAPAPAGNPFGLKSVHALKATPSVDDNVDALANQLNDETAPELAQWLGDIKDMVNHADSLEGLRDDLLNAYGHLPTDTLTDIISAAFAVAEGTGRESANNDAVIE